MTVWYQACHLVSGLICSQRSHINWEVRTYYRFSRIEAKVLINERYIMIYKRSRTSEIELLIMNLFALMLVVI